MAKTKIKTGGITALEQHVTAATIGNHFRCIWKNDNFTSKR